MLEIGSRVRTQPTPPAIIWRALVEPHQANSRAWLVLEDDEVEPVVLEASEPNLVTWSSLWPTRARDQVEFELHPSGGGTALRWTMLTPAALPSDALTSHLRFRLNKIINGDLRLSFGQ